MSECFKLSDVNLGSFEIQCKKKVELLIITYDQKVMLMVSIRTAMLWMYSGRMVNEGSVDSRERIKSKYSTRLLRTLKIMLKGVRR